MLLYFCIQQHLKYTYGVHGNEKRHRFTFKLLKLCKKDANPQVNHKARCPINVFTKYTFGAGHVVKGRENGENADYVYHALHICSTADPGAAQLAVHLNLHGTGSPNSQQMKPEGAHVLAQSHTGHSKAAPCFPKDHRFSKE